MNKCKTTGCNTQVTTTDMNKGICERCWDEIEATASRHPNRREQSAWSTEAEQVNRRAGANHLAG